MSSNSGSEGDWENRGSCVCAGVISLFCHPSRALCAVWGLLCPLLTIVAVFRLSSLFLLSDSRWASASVLHLFSKYNVLSRSLNYEYVDTKSGRIGAIISYRRETANTTVQQATAAKSTVYVPVIAVPCRNENSYRRVVGLTPTALLHNTNHMITTVMDCRKALCMNISCARELPSLFPRLDTRLGYFFNLDNSK